LRLTGDKKHKKTHHDELLSWLLVPISSLFGFAVRQCIVSFTAAVWLVLIGAAKRKCTTSNAFRSNQETAFMFDSLDSTPSPHRALEVQVQDKMMMAA